MHTQRKPVLNCTDFSKQNKTAKNSLQGTKKLHATLDIIGKGKVHH